MATKPTKTKRKMAATPENGRNKLLGYARVSTTDQDLTVQRQRRPLARSATGATSCRRFWACSAAVTLSW